MPKVDLLNLIPVFSRKKEVPEALNGKDPHEAAEAIRKSCTDPAGSFHEWSLLIRQNCPLPHDHPYGKLLESRGVRPDDPLWILGLIAFGTEPSQIVFNAVRWPDGKTDLPDQLNRNWTKK